MATGRDVVGAAMIVILGASTQRWRPVDLSELALQGRSRRWCGSEPTIRISHGRLLKPLNGPTRFGAWSRLSSGPMEWCGNAENGVAARFTRLLREFLVRSDSGACVTG